jgi:glycosyltransferase involved in cell wall biosynthesis
VDVVFIHPSRTSRGGIVNAALVQALALHGRGHRIELWTAAEEVADKAKRRGLTTFSHPALASAVTSLASPAVLGALLGLRRRGVDAVIHHGAKLRLPARIAAEAHSQFVVFHNDKLGGRRHFRNWLCLSRSHAEELSEQARREGLSRTVATIRNGLLDTPAQIATLPGAMSIAPLRIGVLAELKQHKGIDLMLLAAARLAHEGFALELHIGGSGPECEGLLAEASRLGIDRAVTWHGWVDALDAFFERFDVFCLPSRREPFGLVVIEAMARGKVVAASRTKGPEDIITDRRTGYLFPVGDSDALAERLREIAASPAAAAAVAEAGRDHVFQAYSLDAVGAALESAIQLSQKGWAATVSVR